MEDEWEGVNPTDVLDESDNEGELAADGIVATATSASDVIQQVQQSAAAAVQNAYANDNRTHLEHRVLHNGPRTIKITQAVIVRRHVDNSYKGMYLVYEVWSRSSQSKPFKRERKINLDIEATTELLDYLRQAEASANITSGSYLVLPAAEIFDNLNGDQQQTFAHLLEDITRSHRVVDLMTSGQLTTEAVDNLAAAAQHAKYKAALAELAGMVSGAPAKAKKGGGTGPFNEHVYQKWFEDHTWVFGTEYIRRIDFRAIDPHATLDFILETADGYFDVLELKTPHVPVLVYDASHKTWYWSTDVAKVIAQAAKYLNAIERSADRIYRDEKVAIVRPRVRVVIGRSQGWNEEQREAFRRLSATLHGIDLLTFDHVMVRAQQLVNCYEQHPEMPTVELSDHVEDEPSVQSSS